MGLYNYRRYLASERACLQLVRQIRWPRGVQCPRCEHRRIWKTHERGLRKYFCGRCRFKFSDTSGTLFEKTRTPLSKWVLAIGLWKLGCSAKTLQAELGVTYKTAWTMLHAMRRAVIDDTLFRQLSGHVEVDETYFGGRRKGKRGRGAAGKTIVLGLRQRGGRVKTLVVPDLKAATFRRLIQQHVRRGSTIYTDGFWDHVDLVGYDHHIIDHTKRFTMNHLRHTQTVESVWAHTKPDLKARHHAISPQYLQQYLAERDFMFNHRQHPDLTRLVLEKLLTQYPLRG